MDRFVAIVEKFLDYKKKNNIEDFHIGFWSGYSYNSVMDDFQKERFLHNKVADYELNGLLLGGLPHRDDITLKQWLMDRKAIGSEYVVATYSGYKEQHDYWNNKKGNFDFLVNAQKIAHSIGLENEQRFLITRSSLKNMELLLNLLDGLELPIKKRFAIPMFYSGLARQYENERVTMEMLDSQSNRIKAIYRDDKDEWKSERDWIKYFMDETPISKTHSLKLFLTDENIDRIESMSCEEIIEELTLKTQAAYNRIPSREELIEKYSDINNEKVYMFMWDIETVWLDRFLRSNVTEFERELTYFG